MMIKWSGLELVFLRLERELEDCGARLDGGAWPPMPMATRQQVRARLRVAKSWTNLLREWSFARGPFLDDLRQ